MIYKDRNKIEKGQFGWVSKIKDRMYRTITPRGYHIGQAAKEFIKGDTRDMSKFTPLENEVWARYLGTKYEGPSNLESAIYRPTKGEATYDDIVKLKDESQILSDNVLKQLLDNYKKTGKKSMLVKGNESGLGTYTISMGEDEKGKYISYYDDWDINPTRGISAKYNIPILNQMGDIVPGTHPFSVYGRRYYKNGGKMNAIEQFKEGHKIHIKKKNRGKFTAYCGGNVTSACIAKAKASGNPTLVKRATFAANARKWKHQEGGIILSNVDNRTDSTRKGSHEGLPAWGAAGALNNAGLWDLLNYNLTGNPYIITGAPDILPGKVGTIKKSIQSVANVNDKGLNITKKLNTSVKNGLTYEDFDVRHVNAGRNKYTKAQREHAQYMITNSYPNSSWYKQLQDILKKQAKKEAMGTDKKILQKFNKQRYDVLDNFINSGFFR